MTLEFREIKDGDFSVLASWLRQPHVRRWWDDGDVTIESVTRDYGPEEGLVRYILWIEDGDQVEPKAIGLFQHYEWKDDSIGIDLLIGEPDYINKGVGTQAVRLFAELIFGKYAPGFIFLDPHPENAAAIRCYRKAGFVKYRTGLSPGGGGSPH